MKRIKNIDFFVIGFQKCGTSTLHSWLSQESSISLPSQKETHFFSHNDRYKNGIDWYFSQFEVKENCLYGEIDPEYIYWPDAVHRMNELGGKAKIIVLVRNPIERMISHYKMTLRRGIEPLTLDQAIGEEKTRKKANPIEYRKHYSYFERSLYREQIENFQKVYNGNEYLFISFEKLFSEDRDAEYKKICDFLGIKSNLSQKDLNKKINEARAPRFKYINQLIWDKNKFKIIRNITSKIMSKKLKWKIYQYIYNKNSKKPEETFLSIELSEKIKSKLKKEIEYIEKTLKI